MAVSKAVIKKKMLGLRHSSLKLNALQPAIALSLILVLILIHKVLPNKQMSGDTTNFIVIVLILAGLYTVWWTAALFVPSIKAKLNYDTPIIIAILLVVNIWELLTLKSNIFPAPYFPSISKIIGVLFSDWKLLGLSALYSLRLLFLGFGCGALVGIPTGIALGWSSRFTYWMTPVLRVIGPIPSTAWIPIVLVAFPTSLSASVFLVALGTWFALTIMTWSGVANVNKAYFEVGRTLGASDWYMLRKVALPAALPVIFIGSFKALSVSFVALVVAEMLGVRAGLGWYIQWAYGWAEYHKVYAALVVMGLLFSSVISFVFYIRDRVLVWQKGLIKW
ncbi:MAG TPA: sulfonate ABC transporter permease [Pelotomaculum sp.]|nr:sulfonate ABC transporter permease [Pelotomaculum sp.]